MGQTQASKKAVWFKLLLQELYTPSSIENTRNPMTHLAIYSIIFYCENQGIIALAKSSQAHTKSKYIDIQWYYQWKKIEDRSVKL